MACGVALPCLGPLVPRGAAGARHDGRPRQLPTLLPVVCRCLCLCEGFAGPLRDAVNPLPSRPTPSSTVPCSITLVRPSDLATCSCHFSFGRFTVARKSSYGPICVVMVFRTCSLVIRSLQQMPRIFRKHLNCSECIIL